MWERRHCPQSTAITDITQGNEALLRRIQADLGLYRTMFIEGLSAEGLCVRANSVEDAVRRGQRQVEQARIKMGMQMDDRSFQTLLLDSQVLAVKDQTKWNFDILQDLIEGPLLNPKRMEEAIKASRYLRKLISFFHPFAHRFSDLSK